jgi:hypothetical protein
MPPKKNKGKNMLDGINPLFIFNLKKKINISSNLKVPAFIPFYLDPLFGLYVNSQSKQIQIASDVMTNYIQGGDGLSTVATTAKDVKKATIKQRSLTNVVNIELVSGNDKILFNLFLSVCDYIFAYMDEMEYGITYFNQNIFALNAKLANFSYSGNNVNDLITIQMGLLIAKNSTKETNESTTNTVQEKYKVGASPL